MRSIHRALCCVGLITLAACAGSVPVMRMKPASYDIVGVRSVVIVPIGAGGIAEARGANEIARRVHRALQSKALFQQVELDERSASADPSSEALRRAARADHADAAVGIAVQRADVDSYHDAVWVERVEHTGRRITEVYSENGQRKTRWIEEVIHRHIEVPRVRKLATIRLVAQYVPVRSGREQRENIERHEEREAQGLEISALPSDQSLLNTVTDRVTEALMNRLTPHVVTERRVLASAKECRIGNHLARRGDWQGALAAWREALTAYPQSDQLQYNIGVAEEGLEHFSAARAAYQQAQQLKPQRRYEEALQRLASASADHEQTQRQLKGRHSAKK